MLSKNEEKVRNCRCNPYVHSHLQLDTEVNKPVEFKCFGCDTIAISEVRITFWMLFVVAHYNVIRAYWRYTKE